jgi:hypothetical protein
MKRRQRPTGLELDPMEIVRTVSPKRVFAEDFSLLIRGPRRLRRPVPASNRQFLNILH